MPGSATSGPPTENTGPGVAQGRPRQRYDGDIVISGISGKFPESRNMEEFWDNLINHVDMIVDDDSRFPLGYQGVGKFGKVKDIDLFDNEFFGQMATTSEAFHPELRMCIEMTYEAIVDAGESLQSMNGSRTGVYFAPCMSDAFVAYNSDLEKITGNSYYSSIAALDPNRISNIFNFSGPSMNLDSACSTGLHCLEEAIRSIRDGTIDSAVVGGLVLFFSPSHFISSDKMGVFSKDRICKSFDAEGNGYVRSEGGAVMLLQRKTDCKRSYAKVVHGRVNSNGTNELGFTAPNGLSQYQLITDTIADCGINPLDVTYIEAHGTGTKAGDPQEILAFTTNGLFTSGRDGPLLVGSVKSNCGHSEWMSGYVSLAKVLLSIQRGIIPANLNFSKPNPDCPALIDGSVKVVTENTPYDGGLIGINSIGLGGSNAHIIVSPPDTRNQPLSSEGKSTRLFTYGARTETGVANMIEFAKKHSSCIEVQALLQPSANMENFKMPYRGYTVLNGQQEVEEIQAISRSRPPVWFIFTGMGCQWPNMGRDMMQIPLFRQSIERTAKYLHAQGVDLLEFFTKESSDTSLDVTMPLVPITAVQIALVDILRAVGVKPDGIIGHSNGEVGCGYADGCLTPEQAITLAYARSLIKLKGEEILPEGKMAAVGLTWEECLKRCPAGVRPACHNAHDSVTISGEAKAVTKFVEQLVSEGVFAREVKSGGIAFHVPEIKKLDSVQEKVLAPVMTSPKKRSSKWISTCFKGDDLNQPVAQFSSMEYYLSNSSSPVRFHDAVQKIPKDALVIEIGPHGLLIPILKRSLGPDATLLSLMKRSHGDNVGFCLSNIGKCYLNGVDIDPLGLHPPVKFPVPLETPMISSALSKTWDHSVSWRVPKYTDFCQSGDTVDFNIDISEGAEFEYLRGHLVKGRPTIPATCYIVVVWKALAKKLGKDFNTLPVRLEHIRFVGIVRYGKEESVTLKVRVSPTSGQFEVFRDDQLLCDGHVEVLPEKERSKTWPITADDPMKFEMEESTLKKAEFYKLWRLAGLNHCGKFQGIHRASQDYSRFVIEWNGNWLLYLDYVFQAVAETEDNMTIALGMECLEIDPTNHPPPPKAGETAFLKAEVTKHAGSVSCGGVCMKKHYTFRNVPDTEKDWSIEEYQFVPYMNEIWSPSFPSLQQYVSDCLDFTLGKLEGIARYPAQSPFDKNVIAEIISTCSSNTSSLLLPESYLTREDCGLAQVLANLFTHIQNHKADITPEVVQASATTLSKDRLLQSLSVNGILKPVVDIIFDNHGFSPINFLEVNGSQSRMFSDLVPVLDNEPRLSRSYTVGDKISVTDDEMASLNVKSISMDVTDRPSPEAGQYNVLVLKNVLHKQHDVKACLQNTANLITPGGFMIVQEITGNFPVAYVLESLDGPAISATQTNGRKYGLFYNEDTWQEIFTQCDFEVIYKKSDGLMSTLYLLRKPLNISSDPFVIEVDDLEGSWVDELKYTIADMEQMSEDVRIWLVASNYNNGVAGLIKSLKDEGWGKRVRCALVSNLQTESKSPDLSEGSEDLEGLRSKDLMINVFRDGQWGTFSLVPMSKEPPCAPSCNASLQLTEWGINSTLGWKDNARPVNMGESTSMTVSYAGLTFNDHQLLSQELSPNDLCLTDNILGSDAAGYLPDGRRVMTVMPSACRTHLYTKDAVMVEVPVSWSLEDAATVPYAYSTALYALSILTRLRPEDNILIHDAADIRGQAALHLACHLNCNIFTTVSCEKERQELMKLFPQISPSRIASFENKNYVDSYQKETGGYGMDIIFTTLKGDQAQQCAELLAKYGRFIYAGKHAHTDSRIVTANLRPGSSFHEVHLSHVLKASDKRSVSVRSEIADLLKTGMASGCIKPLTRTVYSAEDSLKAVQVLKDNPLEKVIIKIQEEKREAQEKEKVPRVIAECRAKCKPGHSYVIMGGLGGFGLELACWLVKRGCQYLVLSSRRGITTSYQSFRINAMMSEGVQVKVSTQNAITKEGAAALLQEAAKMAPLGGVFNLSLVLKDSVIENMTEENFNAVCDPKIKATVHFDNLTRELYKDSLHWFVMFSSQASARGSLGQTNYAFANSAIERICEKRQTDGFHGLAIQFGWIGDVGYVEELHKIKDLQNSAFSFGYFKPQSFQACVEALETALLQDAPVVGTYVKGDEVARSETTDTQQSVTSAVIKLLGIKNTNSIDGQSLADVGLDSISLTEVKQILETVANVVLSNKEIRKLTFGELKKIDEELQSSGS